MGQLDAAEELLRKANEQGHTPQPALALIRLARGDARAAVDLDRHCGRRDLRCVGPGSDAARPGRDRPRGGPATDRVERQPANWRPSWRPTPHRRRRRGRPTPRAASSSRKASRWKRSGSCGERSPRGARSAPRTRSPWTTRSDRDRAPLERRTRTPRTSSSPLHARGVRALGALVRPRRRRRAIQAVANAQPAEPGRKTFVFTDIVGSTAIAELLGDQAWEQWLGWHDETLRSISRDWR